MMVEIYEKPLRGQVGVDVHSYDPNTNKYFVSLGDTAGIEVRAEDVHIIPEDDYDYGPDDDDIDYDEAYSAWNEAGYL